MLALGFLHQVLETGQVRKAGHGGEHSLVGMGAIGEEVIEEQPLLGQAVETGRDAVVVAQRAHELRRETLHDDKDQVLRYPGQRRGGLVPAQHRVLVGKEQGVAGGEEQVTGQLQRFVLRHHVQPLLADLFLALAESGLPQ